VKRGVEEIADGIASVVSDNVGPADSVSQVEASAVPAECVSQAEASNDSDSFEVIAAPNVLVSTAPADEQNAEVTQE